MHYNTFYVNIFCIQNFCSVAVSVIVFPIQFVVAYSWCCNHVCCSLIETVRLLTGNL